MIKGKLFAVIFIFLVTCLIFFKVFLRGQYPIPGDLLTSFYFPYYSGGWEGYSPWTTHKELLGADSIRQIYLWKEFAADEFKQGKAPLWNPYTFSGQPLLANFQSSVFYPFNIFYFLTNAKNAWLLLVMIQPLLGGLFMYLLLKSYKLEKWPSIFGSIAFMFSSYLITWMENGNVSHSYVWLPLAFWSINNYFQNSKFNYLLILTASLALSILAGHPQTAIYVYSAVGLYWIFKVLSEKKLLVPKFGAIIFVFLASLLVSAVQIIPTFQFYKISPISLPFSREVFDWGILPYKNLITFFASDFFGHPANNNFWSHSYGDFTPYFGVIPLILSLWGIFNLWKEKFVKFLTLVSVLFIFAAVNGPITWAIRAFQIPLIDATTPSRFISISIFLLIILSSLSLADILKNFDDKKYLKKFIYFQIGIGFIYFLMWAFAQVGAKFMSPKDVWEVNLSVTKRNLILPTFSYLSLFAGSLIVLLKPKSLKLPINLKQAFIYGIFAITMLGGVYYTNKFLPTSPKSFIFPDHPIFSWLQDNAGINRFYGGGTAHIDFNFPTHYKVYGAEGYDTLRIERYSQLLASAATGKVPKTYLRSDGVFPTEENGFRKRLFDLLGVKYLLDKEDSPKNAADFHYERFSNDKVKGIWQQDKFQVFQRETVIPRIFQTTRYLVASDEEIINKIYDPQFDLRTLLLESQPPLDIQSSDQSAVEPEIIKYSPGEIIIKTKLDQNSLLFVSDAHDPNWHVKIDGQTTPLLRAHYAFLSAAVPKGEHTVEFYYQSKSFKTGVHITMASLVMLIILGVYTAKKQKTK